jgi:uroporphyrinogen decarboxylase
MTCVAMTSRERLTLALNHQQADRVPVCPLLCGVSRTLADVDYPTWSTDPAACAKALAAAARTYEMDCVVALTDLSVECDAWGQKIVFPENEAAHPDYASCVIRDLEDYATFQAADYTKSRRMMAQIDVCRRLVADIGKEKPVIAFVFGPLGVLSMLRGQENLYMDLMDDPDAVRGALEKVTQTLEGYVRALMDTGVDAIMWDTLFASGSIMSKQMWRETEFDFAARLAQVVRQSGCQNMIHNCGERIYFDVQIEAIAPSAISFLYPPDDCTDFKQCKEKYGGQVTLIGAVAPTLAATGTDEQWDAACRASIDDMAKGGGFVLATGCEYPANASMARAARMVQIAQTYGKY